MGFSDELENNLRINYNKHKELGDKALQEGDYQTAEIAFYKAGNAANKISKTSGEKSRKKWISISKYHLNTSNDLKNGYLPSPNSKKEYHEKPDKRTELDNEIEDNEQEFEKFIENNLIATSTVTWEQIAGLEGVKSIIKESVVLSIISNRPEAIAPWKGILLYGPPGTGKTLLAAATAGSLQATFFNVKVGQLLSKYFGESSKLVTALYNVARKKAPSIIFLDEFDSIALNRGGDISEASRRILSTFLAELDGMKNKDASNYILTIAATNVPWDLDNAVLSRFPKRIHIPLPDHDAVKEMIMINTIKKGLEFDGDFERITEKCVEKMYAGRDISTLCNDAIWNMVRNQNPNLSNLADKPLNEVKNYELKTQKLHIEDFELSFERIEGAVKLKDVLQFKQWGAEYGSN